MRPRYCFIFLVLSLTIACGENDTGTPEPSPDAGSADDTGSADDVGDRPSGDPCATASDGQVRVLTEVEVDGAARAYRLTTPASAAGTRLPILLAFQGGDGGDHPFPQQEAWNTLVDEEQVILISPIAQLLPPNEGAWQLNTREGFTQDVDYVGAIIDDVAARYCVDPDRVYATGYSLGSMFTYELPCHMSDRFAAIASFAGTMPVNPDSCDVETPVAIMHIHGRDDWLIPYGDQWDWKEWDSVGTMHDIPGLIEFWREKYNCQTRDENDAGGSIHLVHSECDGGVRVEHHGLGGVEHDWPHSVAGTSTHRVVWDFVSGFRRP